MPMNRIPILFAALLLIVFAQAQTNYTLQLRSGVHVVRLPVIKE